MRQLLLMIVLATTLVLMMRCSGNETLNSFEGKLVTLVTPIVKTYPYLPYFYRIETDSLKWLYDSPSAEESRVSVIFGGKIQTDSLGDANDTIPIKLGDNHLNFEIETDVNTTPSNVKIVINDDGTFLDTIRIASLSVPELILPQSSRLFISADIFVSDTIPLINPHSSK